MVVFSCFSCIFSNILFAYTCFAAFSDFRHTAMMRSLIYHLRSLFPFTRYPYQGREDPCNLCGSNEKVTLSEHDRRLKRLPTVVCSTCGLQRTDPMPTPDELSHYYASSYRLDYQLTSGKPPKLHLKRSRKAAQERLDLLRSVLTPGAAVLDFGAGSGEFLAVCKEAGCEATGIEPGESYANYASTTYGVKVLNKPWQEADLPESSFDVISTHHVVEHLREPVDALRRLASWLKDDGVLYIAVPDMSPWPGKKTFERFHFAHIYGFTPRTLMAAARAAGLEPDSRFDVGGTMLVLRKSAEGEIAVSESKDFDPTYPKTVPSGFPKSDPVKHLILGGWLVDAAKRLRKDIRVALSKT
jgi:SAM-dependent methyltransferase